MVLGCFFGILWRSRYGDRAWILGGLASSSVAHPELRWRNEGHGTVGARHAGIWLLFEAQLEGLGSIESEAFKYFGRGCCGKEVKWLELNASQSS